MPISYPIFIHSALLQNPSIWLPKHLNFSTIVIITDSHIKKLYANDLVSALKKQGYKVLLLVFSAGEQSKNYATKQYLEEKMLDNHCDRNTLCIALGGGVVGDLAGFIAATYMRGIAYIQCPTTLLAMVDSSVGGKVGINMPQGKNLIGAFWQPKAVVIDLNCLGTLTQKNITCGLVEIVKIFLIRDKKYFIYFKKNSKDDLKKIITRAIKIKVDTVSQDEKENNLRKILNFGHTIGHAIEKSMDYKILHGEAVGMGILIESKISELLGILSKKEYEIIQDVLFNLGVNCKKLKKIDPDKIIQATKLDKKISNGQVNYVLLSGIGQVYQVNQCVVRSVDDAIVNQAICYLLRGDSVLLRGDSN